MPRDHDTKPGTRPSIRPRGSRALTLAVAAGALAASPAHATWSILISDTRTGEIVVGSATCVLGFDLKRETPVILSGIGAITAQSVVDSSGRNRMLARDALLSGVPLSDLLEDLSEQDNTHDNRQYGMITALGDTLTYSGVDNAAWAGGVTGRLERGRPGPLDDIVYAVQGNILSGANVVPAAVDSIVSATGSDLPEMLMDAMVAARDAGGDGRCSCSQGNPTGCGEMIEMPFKSAHIGYMIGSRLGDTNSIRGSYDNDISARGMTTIALDGDNDQDIALSGVDGRILLYTNATGQRDQVSRLVELGSFDPGIGELGTLVGADFDGDGREDLGALVVPSTLAVMRQSAPGVFDAPVTLDLGSEIGGVSTIRIPTRSADDALVTLPEQGDTLRVSLVGGALSAQTLLDTQSQSTSVRIGDADGDGEMDLLVTQRDTDTLEIARGDGAGAFTPWVTLSTAGQPQDSAVSDLNGDSVMDVVVLCDSGEVVQSFLGNGSGFDAPITTPIDNDGVSIRVGDVNQDGAPDLLVRTIDPGLFSSAHRVGVLLGDGAGGFSEIDAQRLAVRAPDPLLVNLNPGFDGDIDTVVASGSDVVLLDNDGSGEFPPSNGFAGGEHYMDFNIANQQNADPDPVDQMLELFGQFRADLMGKPDAVRSVVTPPSRLVTGRAATVRFELRDWRGVPVDPQSASFAVRAVSGSAVATGTAKIGASLYEFGLQTPQTSGRVELEIHVSALGEQIVLMPTLEIPVTDILADLNADGVLNFADVTAFLRGIASGDENTDFDGDGNTDAGDVQGFLHAYQSAATVP